MGSDVPENIHRYTVIPVPLARDEHSDVER